MPEIELSNCTDCMKCVNDCPVNAIDLTNERILTKCIQCGHCVAICPESCFTPFHEEIIPLGDRVIKTEMLENHFAGLRSVRKFKKSKVSETDLNRLISNMKNYSSASNTRLLEITVVQDAEKIRILNDMTMDTIIRALNLGVHPLLRPLTAIFRPGLDFRLLSKYRKSFIKQRSEGSQAVCHGAPLIMLFHGPKISESMLDADANIWAANTVSLAATMGIGSCYIGFIVKSMARNKKLKAVFGIPENHVVHSVLAMGYQAVKYVNSTGRKEPKVSVA
ncbi:nitroreductase family protein [Bacteroidota bacterium]